MQQNWRGTPQKNSKQKNMNHSPVYPFLKVYSNFNHKKRTSRMIFMVIIKITHFSDFDQVITKLTHFADFEQVIITITHFADFEQVNQYYQQNSLGRSRMPRHFFFEATTLCHEHSTLASQTYEGLHQLWALPRH